MESKVGNKQLHVTLHKNEMDLIEMCRGGAEMGSKQGNKQVHVTLCKDMSW